MNEKRDDQDADDIDAKFTTSPERENTGAPPPHESRGFQIHGDDSISRPPEDHSDINSNDLPSKMATKDPLVVLMTTGLVGLLLTKSSHSLNPATGILLGVLAGALILLVWFVILRAIDGGNHGSRVRPRRGTDADAAIQYFVSGRYVTFIEGGDRNSRHAAYGDELGDFRDK